MTRALVTGLLLASLSVRAFAQDDTPAVALLRWSAAGAPYVEVLLTQALAAGETITTTVFSEGEVIAQGSAATPLTIALAAVPDDMTVAIARTRGTAREQFMVAVGEDLSFVLRSSPACYNALSLVVIRGRIPAAALPYANARMSALIDAIGNDDAIRRTRLTLQVDPAGRERVPTRDDYEMVARVPNSSDRSFLISSGGFNVCLASIRRLPAGEFDARLVSSPAIPEFRDGVLATEITVIEDGEAPTVFTRDDAPGDRSLEHNLDVALLGTSSLDKPDDAGIRRRTSVAALDLRLAPWLNVLMSGRRPIGHTLTYFTPVYVDAKVSTGELTKETTSANTVVVGSEFEFRRFPAELKAPVSFHRFIIRAANVANRNYSHVELNGALEWKPVLAAITKPSSLSWIKPALDPDPSRLKPIRDRFGFEISPIVGIEFGRTTRWRNPPAGLENPPNFMRLHAGAESKVEITTRLLVNGQIQTYLRSESPDDRLAVYFKTSAELPIGRPTQARSAAFFMSYEYGVLPPFDDQSLSTFKVGMRVQADGWRGQVR